MTVRGRLTSGALLALAFLGACGEAGAPAAAADARARARVDAAGPVQGAGGESLPPLNAQDRLLRAHHLYGISGDWAAARRELEAVASAPAVRNVLRARAALRLAEHAEATGDRRRALGYLEQVKSVVGTSHHLAQEADDRRARILTIAPLADVRGPVPGSVTLKEEQPHVVARFRRAEQLLASYHRVVVAPRLENVNEVLRTKRRGLVAAVTAYQKVAATAGPAGRAAALYRTGAMYHHLAEALAFAIPTELLPAMAHRLRRKLQAESATYLRKSLSYYREVVKIPTVPGTAIWRRLAAREAKTLAAVLKAPAPRRGR